jgi:uncharacterized protein YukE
MVPGMGDIEVATDELRALGTQLSRLSKDLRSQDGNADYGVDQLAHRAVVGAMDEFRKNWNDNRDHLADKLTKLGELATRTADGFEEADAELAKEVVKAMEESR